MKYYIIAGESSGDLYGSLLMSELKRIDSDATFKFWGGPQMREKSSGQLKSIKETSFMGFYEVAKNALKIKGFFDFAKYSIKEFNPDIVILIDYPGFNLRIAKWAKLQGFHTAYYISPQLWAWKQNRHKILKEYIDLFYVILPFERDFYRNLDTPCEFVGHPLMEIIDKPNEHIQEAVKKIGLFPGSRKQEIRNHLATMIQFAIEKPEYKFIIAGVSHIPKSFYLDHLKQYAAHIDIRYDASHEVMSEIDFAITSSGTATLELALFNVPQIVIYKTHHLSFMIGKRLVKTDYISLVNLIGQKEIVPELLQDAFNELALDKYFELSSQYSKRKETVEYYDKIRKELGSKPTSKLIANGILNFLNKKSVE